jgi:hypothetical protein
MRDVSDKSYREKKTQFVFSNLFPENRTVYERMWGTADGGTVVKVLRYKSEGRWFDSRWCHWNFPLI